MGTTYRLDRSLRPTNRSIKRTRGRIQCKVFYTNSQFVVIQYVTLSLSKR